MPTSPSAAPPTDAEPVVAPIVAETLEVERRRTTTGTVRVSRERDEREVIVDEPLLHETVRIERVPVGRVVDANDPPRPRQDGDTLVVPVLEETLVVERRLVLKEELHLHRERRTVRAPQRVALRTDRVVVERLDADGRPLADPRADAGPDRDAAPPAPRPLPPHSPS
jgi:uncharacterized protein (TIGR02271 family)